tara:strand:- start:217 stop:1182 length:966 start_codon:yes stop_codon:yes gene_type:complete
MKLIYTIFIVFFLASCAINSSKEIESSKQLSSSVVSNESILLSKEVLKDASFITNKYPILGDVEIQNQNISTPRPKQLFSASAANEIRLHKLGEVRWVYLGLEPSSVWPMTIEFLKINGKFELGSFDPSVGVINSKQFRLNGQETKLEFKIERGLQQSSSEIFVSHLAKVGNSWEIIPSDGSNLEEVINMLYEFLSSSAPSTGTSLVALNLNTSNKTEVITEENGLNLIKLRVNFARAWAATRRSLQIAGYKIIDEDRNEGKFYLEYSLRRSLLDRRPDITSVEILVKELSSKECLISTNLDKENQDLSEEIISQINQSLS